MADDVQLFSRQQHPSLPCNENRCNDAGQWLWIRQPRDSGGLHEIVGETLRIAPGLAGATVQELRVALRPNTPDRRPVNVYVATGHGGFGLTVGPYSGAAMADMALGVRGPSDVGRFQVDRFAPQQGLVAAAR